MFLDSENELVFDDPYDTDDSIVGWSLKETDKRVLRQLAAAAIPACQQKGIIISRETISELEYNAVLVLDGKGPAFIFLVKGIDTLLIEFCASDISELTRQVPYRCAALRIPEKQDLSRSCAVKAVISIMRAAHGQLSKSTFGLLPPVPLAAHGYMLTPRWVVGLVTGSFLTH